MPITMYLATILTANHLIVDGIAGSLITVAALVIASRFETWRKQRSEYGRPTGSTGP